MLGLGLSLGKSSFVGGSSFTGLLDEYSGAAAAYSLRRLSSSYTGPAIQVRNKATQTITDIGFDANGDLDMTALAAASLDELGNTKQVAVVTWYDQSGNGNDATQSSGSAQPNIYLGAGPILENGKPAIQFDGSDDYLVNTNGLTTADNHMILSIHSNTTGGFLFSLGYNDIDSIMLWSNITSGSRYWIDSSTSQLNSAEFTTNQRLTIGQQSVGTQSLYIDGSLDSSKSYAYVGDSVPDITIGYALQRNQGANYYSGYIQECIYFNVDQSTNRTGIETEINEYYSIYT